jgi:hypothetical protein
MARARRSRSKNDENDTENGNGKKKKKSGIGRMLKWGAVMAGGAVVGAIAVDKYREVKADKKDPQQNPAHQAMSALFGGSPNPFGPNVHVTNFSGQPPEFMAPPTPPTPPKAPEIPDYEVPEPADNRPDLSDIESEDL